MRSPRYQMWKSKSGAVGACREVPRLFGFDSDFGDDFDFDVEFEFVVGSRWRDDDKRMRYRVKVVDVN